MQEIFKSEYVHIALDHRMLRIQCIGTWPLSKSGEDLERFFSLRGKIEKIIVDASKLQQITSPFLVFLKKLQRFAEGKSVPIEMQSIPESVPKIFKLAQVSETKPPKIILHNNFIYRIGALTLELCSDLKRNFQFFLSIVVSLFRLPWQCPKSFKAEILPFFQQTGVDALPIVSLISVLVGLIMAFVSVVQLERFGASIYVADLVGLAMTREMGCLMTGVIMAGRTGAAFAASIGSMQANEELDALQTFGIDKMIYLVLPRVFALALMMPLLCIFADLIGIIGGMISSLPFMKCTITQYVHQTKQAIGMTDIFIGLLKSFCFGIVVAGIGCCKGIRCGRNAAAVGNATTAAVVQGITWIIIVDAIFAVICTAMGI
ncbi:MAG: ABC transporter permease [Puniceicoccales bacterium]|jgi:phospholipid/cholesterol/gamma-HCH transport system permease protein|nr:ABC transporter permease [Puniceicoccales bacterium]